MYKAVLDTCVLVPSLQRDFVLQLAAEHTFAPQWSSGVLDELQEVLARLDAARGRGLHIERHRRLVAQMDRVFPGASVPAPRDRVYGYQLKDEGDEHVLHAALMSGADAIVTDDRRAGLETSPLVEEARIDVLRAPEFITHTVAAHRESGARAVLELFGRRVNPPVPSPMILLEHLCSGHGMLDVFDLLKDVVADQEGMVDRME